MCHSGESTRIGGVEDVLTSSRDPETQSRSYRIHSAVSGFISTDREYYKIDIFRNTGLLIKFERTISDSYHIQNKPDAVPEVRDYCLFAPQSSPGTNKPTAVACQHLVDGLPSHSRIGCSPKPYNSKPDLVQPPSSSINLYVVYDMVKQKCDILEGDLIILRRMDS
jgi:hypothetical protein